MNEGEKTVADSVVFAPIKPASINVSVKIALGDKVFELNIDEVDRLAKILNKLCGLMVFNPADLINLSQPKPAPKPAPGQPVAPQTVPGVIGGTIPPGLQAAIQTQ